MSYFTKALQSFENFNGCLIPTDPTSQAEFEALEPAADLPVWTGTAPTYADVAAKATELEEAAAAKVATKRSAYEKMGLTEAEIAAIL